MQPGALHRFFRERSQEAEYAVLLGGSAEVTPLNQWALIGLRPRQVLTLQGNTLTWNDQAETVDAAEILFDRLHEAYQRTASWPGPKRRFNLPFGGGLCGVFGYGFYRWCDSAWEGPPLPDADQPDMLLCEFEDWLLIRLSDAKLFVLSEDAARRSEYERQWEACTSSKNIETSGFPDSLPQEDMEPFLEQFETSFSKPAFETAVEHLKTAIYQGEIYQANLSMRFWKQTRLDPHVFYEAVCRRNPSPFSAFLKYRGGMILSNSPERLVRMDETGKLETRPIAGTRGRGKDPKEDKAVGRQLLENEKERAEHLMLVDLARNDLGRVSMPGSVHVDELLALERYSHVTHLVSNVIGQRDESASPWDVLRALFPGGTITGCPKIRCMEILNRLEPVPRGFYTGSIGYIDAVSGALDFNILIRSLYLRHADPYKAAPFMYNAAIHVGAGVVYDSVGAHEYRECLRKATALLSVLKASEQAYDQHSQSCLHV